MCLDGILFYFLFIIGCHYFALAICISNEKLVIIFF
jgi:hypothetical protein